MDTGDPLSFGFDEDITEGSKFGFDRARLLVIEVYWNLLFWRKWRG